MAILSNDFHVSKDDKIIHSVYGLCKIRAFHARKKRLNGIDLIPLDADKLKLLVDRQNKKMSRQGGGMAHTIGWFYESDFNKMKAA